MAGIRCQADLAPEDRAEVEKLLEQIIPIEPINRLEGDLKSLWPSLQAPVFLDKVHFDLEEHGYMALGAWPEPLAAAAMYCVWGEERVREVVRWIALARMNFGFGWRVLLDWNLLAGLKNHKHLVELMHRDDAEIKQVEGGNRRWYLCPLTDVVRISGYASSCATDRAWSPRHHHPFRAFMRCSGRRFLGLTPPGFMLPPLRG